MNSVARDQVSESTLPWVLFAVLDLSCTMGANNATEGALLLVSVPPTAILGLSLGKPIIARHSISHANWSCAAEEVGRSAQVKGKTPTYLIRLPAADRISDCYIQACMAASPQNPHCSLLLQAKRSPGIRSHAIALNLSVEPSSPCSSSCVAQTCLLPV